MPYRLRTLLILMAVGPPLVAGMWWFVESRRNDLDHFRRPFSGAVELYQPQSDVE